MYAFFRKAAEKHGQKIAMEYGSTTFTYTQLLELIDTTADAFLTAGIEKGDVISVCIPDIPAFTISIYATSKIGAKASIINCDEGSLSINSLLRNTHSKMLIIDSLRQADTKQILNDTEVNALVYARRLDYLSLTGRLKLFTYTDINLLNRYFLSKELISNRIPVFLWETLLGRMTSKYITRVECESCSSDGESCAIYYHSGGAAGVPKTIMVSSKAINEIAQRSASVLSAIESDDRALAYVDNAYPSGFCASKHTHLCYGNTIVLIPKYKNQDFLSVVDSTKASMVYAYPSVLMTLCDIDRSRNKNLSHLHTVISTGAVFQGDEKQEFIKFMDGKSVNVRILEIYGLSEASSVCAFSLSDIGTDKTLGIPLPGVLINVIDESTMAEKAYGEKGEICVYTPGAMIGYLDDEDGTNRILHKHRDGRIWIHTGDIGHKDEEGFVYFDGKLKRCLDIAGVHVYPSVIEDTIRSVYGVEEVCVIDLPDTERDRKLVAYVVPDEKFFFDNNKLEALKQSIETECQLVHISQMQPSEIVFKAYLPKNSYGSPDFKAIFNEATKEV